LPATLIDIARETNTSVSTVSRVLAGGAVAQRISEETRARVLDAATRLGYRPNLLARSLRTRKSNTIAMLVPDIGNPFYARIASFIEQRLHPHGYSLLVCNSGETGQREAEYMEMLPRKGIDGLIVVPLSQCKDDLLGHLAKGLPLVILDRACPGIDAVVASDQEQGARLLCETLLNAGVKRIGLFAGPESVVTHRRRAEVIGESFKVVARCIESSLANLGKDAVGEFKSHKLDAVVCTNGQLAEAYLGALKAPDKKLIVACVDDIKMKNLVPMPVVCVLQDLPGMAEGIVSQLLPQLGREPFTPQTILLPMRLDSNLAFKERTNGKQLATA
jgi:DNA-binding LacI/PurR family transcriptional regulator